MKNQKKVGAILSYFNLALNMCISVFFTPFLISGLGEAEYGLYRTIQSFAGQFVVMTFGMSTLVTRNIVYYDELKQKKEKENFLAMALIISFILVGILLLISIMIYPYIDNIFENSFTLAEVRTAKILFVLFVVNVTATILNDYFAGMLTGHEKFLVSNGIKSVNRIFRIIILVILLNMGCDSVAIVGTDLLLTVMMLLFNSLFGVFRLREKIKFHYLDFKMLKETLLFSSAIFLQAIINQVNNNLDSFILGVMTNTKIVAKYSIALTVFNAYASLTTVIVSIFTPQATRMVTRNVSGKELTDFVAKTGRYQFIIAGAVVGGYIIFGKNFIELWVGKSYLDAYIPTIILIIPITVPLIESCINAILDAKLKRMARSVILCIMALINVVTSVIFVKLFGYIGAAYGTALSVIIGHGIIMNIYYQKVIGLNVLKIFKDIFNGLLPSIVAVAILSIPISKCIPDTFIGFIIKIVLFMCIYSLVIYRFGMNNSEKMLVKSIFAKLKK